MIEMGLAKRLPSDQPQDNKTENVVIPPEEPEEPDQTPTE